MSGVLSITDALRIPKVSRVADFVSASDRSQVMTIPREFKPTIDNFGRPITENTFMSFGEGDDPQSVMNREFRPCVGMNCGSAIINDQSYPWQWERDKTSNYIPVNYDTLGLGFGRNDADAIDQSGYTPLMKAQMRARASSPPTRGFSQVPTYNYNVTTSTPQQQQFIQQHPINIDSSNRYMYSPDQPMAPKSFT